MRRRPQEDDEKQNERLEPDLSGRCCPPNHGWKRTSGTADDNVLWRLPLQPYRVHADIEEDREGEQRGCCDVERESKNGNCAAAQNKPKRQRFGARDLAARNW